jgi:hypothetical protein
LKTQPKPVLASLPLAFAFPEVYLCFLRGTHN